MWLDVPQPVQQPSAGGYVGNNGKERGKLLLKKPVVGKWEASGRYLMPPTSCCGFDLRRIDMNDFSRRPSELINKTPQTSSDSGAGIGSNINCGVLPWPVWKSGGELTTGCRLERLREANGWFGWYHCPSSRTIKLVQDIVQTANEFPLMPCLVILTRPLLL